MATSPADPKPAFIKGWRNQKQNVTTGRALREAASVVSVVLVSMVVGGLAGLAIRGGEIVPEPDWKKLEKSCLWLEHRAEIATGEYTHHDKLAQACNSAMSRHRHDKDDLQTWRLANAMTDHFEAMAAMMADRILGRDVARVSDLELETLKPLAITGQVTIGQAFAVPGITSSGEYLIARDSGLMALVSRIDQDKKAKIQDGHK
mgnify:CR=1 FL=1